MTRSALLIASIVVAALMGVEQLTSAPGPNALADEGRSSPRDRGSRGKPRKRGRGRPLLPRPYLWQIREALPAPLMEEDPNAPVVNVAAEAALTPPLPEDLDPTIDVQITQEIIDKADELGTVEAMYEFVRNECAFQAYYGSQKGSVETLRQRSGNDYDLATLLIALLRASGIPARYAVGMIEMPVDRATSWLGVEDGEVAGSILYTLGMEGISIIDGGGNVVAVRARRVWVEAYVPRGRGSPAWVPLDPAFVQTSVHAGLDIPEEMGLDAQAFVDEYYDPVEPAVTLPRQETVLELLEEEITDYLSVNHPGMTLADVRRTAEIVPEHLGVLPASLPFMVRSRDTEFSEIPADRRYQIRFHLYNGGTNLIDHTVDLPTVASKRITISYEGATPADQATIESHNGLLYTPPNLIDIRPLLKVGGQTVASGAVGVDAGITHNSDIHFLAPVNAQGFPQNVVPAIYNVIIAGTYQAIGLAVHGVTNPLLAPADPADEEGFLAQLRYATAMGYLERCIVADDGIGALLHVKVGRNVDDAIVEDQIVVTTDMWGDPVSWEWRGLTVDADRKIIGAWKVDEYETGCGGDKMEVMILGGAEGSLHESLLFEDSFYHEAVSTIKILELAVDQGITVYTRWDTLPLPANTLPASVQNAIENSILNGREVTFPADQITHFNWTGSGYIDLDPCSGAAGYIIAGGQNGGSTVDEWTDIIPVDPEKTVDCIEGDVEVPPSDSPDLSAVFSKASTTPLHFEYKLRVKYTDGTAEPWQTFTHDSKSPSQLAAGHYTLTVGDCGPDHIRKLTVVTLDKVQYNRNGTWIDVPASGFTDICKDSNISFKAIPKPAGGPWPTGYPKWSGDASGTGEQKTVTFASSGGRSVIAECGDSVTVPVAVDAANTMLTIPWPAAGYTSNNVNAASTTTERVFTINYIACADIGNNVWRVRVQDISGGVDIVVNYGGSRNAITNPPTTEAEAQDAVTVMKGYYARGSRGSWHTEDASKAHEEHHYSEWKCSSEHYWPTGETAIEDLTVPYDAHANEAAAITALRAGASGADAINTDFKATARTYWFLLADNASSRPYAAGQLTLNAAVQSVQTLAATNGWTVPAGVDTPSAANPCYEAYPAWSP